MVLILHLPGLLLRETLTASSNSSTSAPHSISFAEMDSRCLGITFLIKTMPHPGFPTDMQPQMAVLLALADGTSLISESIWSNRFRYAEQLNRMGASIKVDGQLAVVQGVEQLKGAPVKADDLRAGAAMLIAGLAATGTTEVEDILHIDRGYEDVVEKFRGLGANIKRAFLPDPSALVNAG